LILFGNLLSVVKGIALYTKKIFRVWPKKYTSGLKKYTPPPYSLWGKTKKRQ